MKKSKLSVGLVTSFIAATALCACGSTPVTKDEDSLLTFKSSNGTTTIGINKDAMYEDYKKASNISDFYNQVLEVMIRYDFMKDGNKTVKNYNAIEAEAQAKIDAKIKEAKSTAKTNKTDYDDEWESILESNGVETTKELKELYIYQEEKTQIENWYYDYITKADSDYFKGADNKNASLLEEWIGVNQNGESTDKAAKGKLPYHISHILVETASSSSTKETIDASVATSIVNIVRALKTGTDTFGSLAQQNSTDGSASEFGDVDILENTVSEDGNFGMVKEFQLAIYVVDALLSKGQSTNEAINNGLGLTEEIAAKIRSNDFSLSNKMDVKLKTSDYENTIKGLAEVPYNVFDDLYEYANTTATSYGANLADGNANIYPRNVLWNRYLNLHNPFIITNRNRTKLADIEKVSDKLQNDFFEKGFSKDIASALPGQAGFRAASEVFPDLENLPEDMKVLTDENGDPIIGVRSQYGLHFIVVKKSIYDFNDASVNLNQYYSTLVPSEYTEENKMIDPVTKQKKTTYVNNKDNVDLTEFRERSNKLINKIKEFDSTYEYRVYEYLYGKYAKGDSAPFKFENGLDTYINSYIKLQRDKKADAQEEGLEKAWTDYLNLIKNNNFYRADAMSYVYNDAGDERTRLVPEGCAIGFLDGKLDSAEYAKGGRCYYGK